MSVAVQPHHRPLRGSRFEDFYPPISAEGPSLSSLDSAFQLQEYIALLVRQNPHDVKAIVATPERGRGSSLSSTPEKEGESEGEKEGKSDVEESLWIYEQLRRLAQDLTHPLITSLQIECTRASCPEMKAGEWLYLCVAHGQEGALEQCCAIDYIIHTLDSATALLNSPRAFPSRLTIPASSVRHFPSLARRLGRIFAHAYFHHREAFEHAEAESALYARFLALTERFKLVPAEFLVIPSQAQSRAGEDTEAPRLPAAMGPPSSSSSSAAGDSEEHRPAEGQSSAPASASAALSMTAETHATAGDSSAETADAEGRGSASPTGLESPRKMGRSRTDTMIFSDAAAFSEELRASGSGFAGSRNASSASAVEQREPARPNGRTLWEDKDSAPVAVEKEEEDGENQKAGSEVEDEQEEAEAEAEAGVDIRKDDVDLGESREENESTLQDAEAPPSEVHESADAAEMERPETTPAVEPEQHEIPPAEIPLPDEGDEIVEIPAEMHGPLVGSEPAHQASEEQQHHELRDDSPSGEELGSKEEEAGDFVVVSEEKDSEEEEEETKDVDESKSLEAETSTVSEETSASAHVDELSPSSDSPSAGEEENEVTATKHEEGADSSSEQKVQHAAEDVTEAES